MSGRFPRPLPITTGKHPFEVASLLASVFVGIMLAITKDLPKSAEQTMHPIVQWIWVTFLILSGMIALIGIFWRGRLGIGLRVEMSGILMLAGVSSMYVIALFSVSGWQALVAGSLITGMAVGSWWRGFQILNDLRRLHASISVEIAAILTEETGP